MVLGAVFEIAGPVGEFFSPGPRQQAHEHGRGDDGSEDLDEHSLGHVSSGLLRFFCGPRVHFDSGGLVGFGSVDPDLGEPAVGVRS